LYAAVIAKKTDRTLVLPRLLGTGTQLNDSSVTETDDNSVPFESVYDVDTFASAVSAQGLKVVLPSGAPPLTNYTHMSFQHIGFDGLKPVRDHSNIPHVALDCTLFKLSPSSIEPEDLPLMWAVLDGLVPNAPHQKVVRQAITALHKLHAPAQTDQQGGSQLRFNVLHLRMESDWVAHCQRWGSLHDGIVRDNCYNNTDTIHAYLRLVNFPPSVPLYVAAYWPDVDHGREEAVMGGLRLEGYKVVTSRDLATRLGVPGAGEVARELGALVDYALALACDRFIGNSVSTFSALAILERRHRGQWAAYYNGGNMPVTMMLPGMHQLPWVFTANSWSEPYDHMLKIAVQSAQRHGGLKPYCLFLGNTSSPLHKWLAARKVTLLRHEPEWRERLVAVARSHMKENTQYSPLYTSADMLVSTFQRIDIARTPVLDQYSYVLYTDADVYFRRRITLDDFRLPLPTAVGMAVEFLSGAIPYNAGIMLMHLPRLRATYDEFLQFIMSNTAGLHFGQYGPADQGAFNAFYKDEVHPKPLDQSFNARPHNPLIPYAAIVHYHGPKPADYLRYIQGGKCGSSPGESNFYWLCENAFSSGGLCSYVTEWGEYLGVTAASDHDHIPLGPARVAARLMDACSWLNKKEAAPTWNGREEPTQTMRELHNKRWHDSPPPAATTTQQGDSAAHPPPTTVSSSSSSTSSGAEQHVSGTASS